MSIEADCGMNLASADFTIDGADERLLGPNGPVKLGNKASRVLLIPADHEGRPLTKDALFSSVWDGTIDSESALTSAIRELRHQRGADHKANGNVVGDPGRDDGRGER